MKHLLVCLASLTGSVLCLEAHAASLDQWARMKNIRPLGYVCHRAAGPLTIDGRLTDEEWSNAPWTADFQDIEGAVKPRPRFRTRAKMLWDDHFFYIAAELEEPHIWGTLTEHDSVIFHDNDFEVFIDPEGDTHDYFEFEMNALNTTWDLLLKKRYIDGGPALNEWEIPGLQSAVHIEGTLNDPRDVDRRWTLEIAFPWKSLAPIGAQGKAPREGEQWRVNFSRVQWQIDISDGRYSKVPGTREDNWVWSPQGIVDMHRPEKWGYVQFSGARRGSVRVAPDPAAGLRDALVEIYYAQRDFHARKLRWAATLGELDVQPGVRERAKYQPGLELTAGGYQASGVVSWGASRPERWHIRQDGKLWKD